MCPEDVLALACTIFGLQLLDRPGQGRLGQTDLPSGPPEVQRLGDRQEGAEVLDVKHTSSV